MTVGTSSITSGVAMSTMEAALINAQAEEPTPAWVGKLISKTSAIQRWPVQLILFIIHAAIFAYNGYAAMNAVHAAGLAYDDTTVCAIRASLF